MSTIFVYQITLEGFESNGTQDHLVKWIKAPSPEAVDRFVERFELKRVAGDLNYRMGEDEQYDIEDGVDVVITEDAFVLRGNIGSTQPIPLKKLKTMTRHRVKTALEDTIEALQEYNSEDVNALTVERTSELINQLKEALDLFKATS